MNRPRRQPGSSRCPAPIAALLAASMLLVAGMPAAQATPAAARQSPTPLPPLPTPPEHYEQYDVAAAARALLPQIALRMDPATLQRVMAALGQNAFTAPPALTVDEALELLDSVDLEPWRNEIIELVLHASAVLELIPEEQADWVPLAHDSLLVVLHGMTLDRLRARIAGFAGLSASAGRGDRMLAFAAETPIFQKIGQIMARSTWLPEDLKAPFRSLESDIVTANREELVAIIRAELGDDTMAAYHVELEPEVLSEASVGAVIGGAITPPGETVPQPVVFKVIKDYAVAAIDEDLESINRLVELLEENRDFYDIGGTPLVDMFQEVRDALAREIRATEEREHLRKARAYFADDPRVIVPWVCDCSSRNVTVMERIDGIKVSDAYPGDVKRRRKLAGRLADIMMYDVMFAPGEALFHGDPHAGNVFFVGGETDPYRIALLDWGLQGTLSFEQRSKLVQVGLGLQLRHAERLRENVDGLLLEPIDLAADAVKVDAVIANLFAAADELRAESGEAPGTLDLLDRLVVELAEAGYTVDGDVLLYVKAAYTINGVMSDLDPAFDSGDYMAGRVRNQVLKEMPKRLANTVWIPGMWSHEYKTMASNNDVWARALNSIGLGLKGIGVGIWKGVSYPFR